MNFIFECSTRYLTSSLRSLVRYGVEHEKIKFISTSGHVKFCLLYKNTNNDVFDDFPKISDHFPKISEDYPKLFQRLDERFRTFSEHFPKIAEDVRRWPKISGEGLMMLRSYNNTSEYFFKDYGKLLSRVKIRKPFGRFRYTVCNQFH